jgi:hypothetical protein
VKGWAWDITGASPAKAVILTTPAGTIAGSAQVGTPRPDVTKAIHDVKAVNIGWEAKVTVVTPGSYRAYAILSNFQSACPLPGEARVTSEQLQ